MKLVLVKKSSMLVKRTNHFNNHFIYVYEPMQMISCHLTMSSKI